MSRVSGFAMVILIGAFGVVAVVDGYFRAITHLTGIRILIPLFFLLFAAVIYDSIRTRMRRSKPRTSQQRRQ
jgi:hypothetical protein